MSGMVFGSFWDGSGPIWDGFRMSGMVLDPSGMVFECLGWFLDPSGMVSECLGWFWIRLEWLSNVWDRFESVWDVSRMSGIVSGCL